MNSTIKYFLNRFTALLYTLGALCFVGYFMVSNERLAVLLEHIGLSVIITTVVACALNFRFEHAIEDRFSIIKGAEGSGFRSIYINREAAHTEIIRTAFGVSNKIDILAIAGTSFFTADRKMLGELVRRCQDKSNIEVRILLLDPRSQFAVERSLREENPSKLNGFAYEDTKLCDDIVNALGELEGLLKDVEEIEQKEKHRFNIGIRLYNAAPMLMYIRIDDAIFAEQYHYGIVRRERVSHTRKCLGQQIPVIEAGRRSALGEVLESHFDFLWQDSKERTLLIGSKHRIEEGARLLDVAGMLKEQKAIADRLQLRHSQPGVD